MGRIYPRIGPERFPYSKIQVDLDDHRPTDGPVLPPGEQVKTEPMVPEGPNNLSHGASNRGVEAGG